MKSFLKFLHENSLVSLRSSIRKKYKEVINLKLNKILSDDLFEISAIEIKVAGRGIGSKVMKELTDWADKNKKFIILEANPEIGGNIGDFGSDKKLLKKSTEKLINFYRKFGFKGLTNGVLNKINKINLDVGEIISEQYGIKSNRNFMVRMIK